MVTNKELKERVDYMLDRLDALEENVRVKRLSNRCVLGGEREDYLFVPSRLIDNAIEVLDADDGEYLCFLDKDTVKKLWKAIK